MKWSEYVERQMGTRQQSEVALLAGVSQSAISRWLNDKGGVSAEQAVNFARACKGNPLEALIVLGIVFPEELDQVVQLGASGEDLTNGQLVELIARRLGVPVSLRGVRGA